jgi:hypothetical protein
LTVNGGTVVVVVGGTVVVVVGGTVVEVVVVGLVVVIGSASWLQAPMTRASTSKTAKRRYMVDLGVIVRSPSRDLPGTITV